MGGDYSKQAFKAKKHYSDVLMQQGKVQLDSDWNEQAAIQFRRRRAQTIDTIGRAVVPRETQNGFRISIDSGELNIHPGRMYVDGLLAENHGRLYADDGSQIPREFDETLEEERTTTAIPYDSQPYLFFDGTEADLPALPYLVYLDVWQREVTYLKDPEIVETALGVDTTTRMQTMWQVRTEAITTVTDPECEDTLSEWNTLTALSDGRLSTGTVPVDPSEDPCLIPPSGGYRGLENRLYRVEVHDPGPLGTATFKWARHNGAVASSITEIDSFDLTVAQSQWDEYRRFEVDDWVEITDNKREYDGDPGIMAKVTAVNYATNLITINENVSSNFTVDDPTDLLTPKRHVRIRKWDQHNTIRDSGGGLVIELDDASDGLIPTPTPTISGTAVVLEDGITVTFSTVPTTGQFKTGDYWLFAARTDDGSLEQLDEAPPEGIHHHYAKLAIITSTNEEDCRIHWPPELEDQTCCTVTVGDEIQSHGDYQTIQDAINSLPTTGGKVCVLPGTYNEDNILINNLSNVIIEGCGTRSKVISPLPTGGVPGTDPVFHVTDSTDVHIAALEIEASTTGNGILCEELTTDSLSNIKLNELHIKAASRSAIEVHFGRDIDIQNCHIEMQDVTTDWPGIFLVADKVLLRENTVIAIPTDQATTAASITAARGGIQIGGTSDNVRVIDNFIQGGIGNGITLGSLMSSSAAGAATGQQWVGWVDDPNTGLYESMGIMINILIEHNRIFDMGMNGIGVAAFFNLDSIDEFISIEELTINRNEIRKCLSQPLSLIDEDMAESMGYGGIALADIEMLTIKDNVIEDNGRQRDTEPVCGIYVLHAEGTEICDNRIINNGKRVQQEASPGPRGGIHIELAITPTVFVQLLNTAKLQFPRQSGMPALSAHNNIVVQPLGRALSVTALGPVSVTANQFTSRGVISNPNSFFTQISTVAIMNLGVSDEFFYLQQLLTFSAIRKGKVADPAMALEVEGQEGLDDSAVGRSLTNGNVLFNDNQCVCDLLGTPILNLILSSVVIVSLDDIAFHNNQCECNLDLLNITGFDFVLSPVFLLGLTVRMSDNRMKEGLLNALISAFSWGMFMSTATDNQATHCLVLPEAVLDYRTIRKHNIVFVDPRGENWCEGFANYGKG